jgi:uncharacterized membrane protein
LGDEAINLCTDLERYITKLGIGAKENAEIFVFTATSKAKIKKMVDILLEQSQLFNKYITIGSSAGAVIGVIIGVKYWEPPKDEVVKVAVGGAYVGALTGGLIGYLAAKCITLIVDH